MDGWMDGWMDRYVDRQTGRQIARVCYQQNWSEPQSVTTNNN